MEKIIYTHNCQNSMIELVKTRGHDFGPSVEAAELGQSYETAVKSLNTFPFKADDFWSVFGDK